MKKEQKTIPNRVKEFREERAWAKAKLAHEASVASATLERVEAGLPTRKDRRLAIAKALGQPYDKVFPNSRD